MNLRTVAVIALMCSAALAYSSCSDACKPWRASLPCTSGNTINMRVLTDVNPAYANGTYNNGTFTPNQYNGVPYVTYGFCPIVDDLEAIHVTGFVNDTFVNDTESFGLNNTVYIRMYGLGSVNTLPFPTETDPTVAVLAKTDFGLCQHGEVAIVNFLVLNITMKNGLIHYRDDGTPLFTGFQSTCSGGVCLFGAAGSERPCIGNGATSNCAQCYNPNTTNLANLTVSIWTSFYGTDKDGTPFTSGEDNPLNFRQFALDSTYDAIASDVTGTGIP